MKAETKNQIKLRWAKDALGFYHEAEVRIRHLLAGTIESKKRAKERYEELFAAEEKAEVARRKADYRHSTK